MKQKLRSFFTVAAGNANNVPKKKVSFPLFLFNCLQTLGNARAAA